MTCEKQFGAATGVGEPKAAAGFFEFRYLRRIVYVRVRGGRRVVLGEHSWGRWQKRQEKQNRRHPFVHKFFFLFCRRVFFVFLSGATGRVFLGLLCVCPS